ncbi:MAG: hypothetical protein ACKO23_13515, partial [Gemmataceae bacterium]
LIMGLVGTLVFFLLEIAYPNDGPWKTRLQWILFFFVFGSVLVARISMDDEISSRAGLYGSMLALVTYLGMSSFIEFPPAIRDVSFLINLVLILTVWWCSYRLTWDCTNISEDTDMSGQGLLQAAGLQDEHEHASREEPIEEDTSEKGAQSWWERYRSYRENRNRKRTLGVWVVYFSFAALPIFGLGQSLIPVNSPDRRRFAFWLMTIYIACGLGLLMTTCFLGLRRYLRQKRLQMPAAMTASWLSMGATLLVVLLLVGAILPRPYSESPITELFDPLGSAKRKASPYALKGDSATDGKGSAGEGKSSGKDRNAGQDGGGRGQEKGQGQGQSQGKDSSSQSGGREGQGQGKDGQGQGQNGDRSSNSGRSGGKQGEGKGSSKNDGRSGQQSNQGNQGEKSGNSSNPDSKNQDGSGNQRDTRTTGSSPPMNSVQQALQKVGPILKWIVFAILAILVLFAILRGVLGFFSNFTSWAKNLLNAWRKFWENLFGGPRSETETENEEEEQEEEVEPAVPFRAFANPFDSGKAKSMSPHALVRYTYRAVEAWGREQDMGRKPDETAIEFLGRLGEEVPSFEKEALHLGKLHAWTEYARVGLPASTSEQVQAIWEKLERAAVSPMSA